MRLGSKNRLILLAALLSGAACTNPTINPEADFSALGKVVDGDGNPLANAEVRLIKYWSTSNLLQPSPDQLFEDTPTRRAGSALEIELVQTAMTNMNGEFEMDFKGEAIAQPGGFMSSSGLVEVADAVIVVRDPSDSSGKTGAYTLEHTYMNSGRSWSTGQIDMWDAGAQADTSQVSSSGQVHFSWNLPPDLGVDNYYRLSVGAPNEVGPQLILGCRQNELMATGCYEENGKLHRNVSALSISSFYASATGDFVASLRSRIDNIRYVSKVSISGSIQDITQTRDPVGLEGVWAVGPMSDQDLSGGLAVDGNPATRAQINNEATEIYVKLPLTVVTDAGVLGGILDNASEGCLVLEFNSTAFADLAAAKGSDASTWEARGRFCGQTSGNGEVSALSSFDTSSSVKGVTAAWMRLRAESLSGSMGTVPSFTELGEVAVYKAKE